MEKSIRVNVMGRDYALRVEEANEAAMKEVGAHVNARMERFHKAHPDQAKLTAAVVTALGLAEELHETRRQRDDERTTTTEELEELSRHLTEVLPPQEPTNGASQQP